MNGNVKLVVVAAALASAVLVACGDDPSAPPPDAVLRCGDRVEGAPGLPVRRDRDDLVVGGIRFYGLRSEARRARRRPGAVGRRYRRGAGVVKVLAGVRAGVHATVEVERSERPLAGLMYGPSPDPKRLRNRIGMTERSVEFQACDADQPRFSDDRLVGPITHFAGGFLFVRASCLRLLVAERGRPARRYSLGYGVPPARC
jgi:hypothetical protein